MSRFVPNFSADFIILRRLISEKEAWIWTAKEDKEFNKIKALVGNVDTMKYYDVKKSLEIECDASSYGLGAVVFQSDEVIG